MHAETITMRTTHIRSVETEDEVDGGIDKDDDVVRSPSEQRSGSGCSRYV